MGESTRRKLLFALLYASEGAPIGFLWKGLVPHMRDREFGPDEVGTFLAVILLPWTWKFLWAPLVDALRGPRWGYGAWVFTAQAAMGVALVPLIWLDLQADFGLVMMFCVIHAFLASTQDVAIDGLAISITPQAELGSVNAWMAMGKTVGRAAFGALTLLLLASHGMAGAVPPVCGMIWGMGLVAFLALRVAEPPLRNGGLRATVPAYFAGLWSVVRTRVTVYGVVFAATAGAAFEALGQFLGYVLKDRGYTDGAIALFWFPVEPACTVAGALAGGWLAGRLGLRRGVALAHVILTAMVALVAVGTEYVPRGGTALLVFAGAYYIAYGWFLTGSYALFMGLTHRAVAATQFTMFMAMTNLCENWAAKAGGILYRGFGPMWGFLALVPISLAALPLLLFLRPSRQ